MLWQLHWQDVDTGKLEFREQRDFPDGETHFDFALWWKGVNERHPLPANKRWFVCNELAPEFIKECER